MSIRKIRFSRTFNSIFRSLQDLLRFRQRLKCYSEHLNYILKVPETYPITYPIFIYMCSVCKEGPGLRYCLLCQNFVFKL